MKFLVVFATLMMIASPAASRDFTSVAEKYQGLHEHRNRRTLKKLVGADPARIRWCGFFAGAVVRSQGYRPPQGYPRARSWSTFGRSVAAKSVRRGDVVVMRSHVTFFTRRSGSKVCGVGGNQSNQVKESCYPARRVIAYRRGVK
jgi:uncharacterized protein (TIGR02594 family)